MHQALNRGWRPFVLATGGAESEGWAIPLDVVEEDGAILVRASVPGLKPEDIDVSIEDNLLTIKAETKVEGERQEGGFLMRELRSGTFHRSLRLPDSVDADNARTDYENGVLTVTLPKAESKKAKHLLVTAGKAPEGNKK
jgi:HSP20 family protein